MSDLLTSILLVWFTGSGNFIGVFPGTATATERAREREREMTARWLCCITRNHITTDRPSIVDCRSVVRARITLSSCIMQGHIARPAGRAIVDPRYSYICCGHRLAPLMIARHQHRRRVCLEPNSTIRTPSTDTTNGQAHNNSTTNLPHVVAMPEPNIGVGAQSTLEGKKFLPENICMKN